MAKEGGFRFKSPQTHVSNADTTTKNNHRNYNYRRRHFNAPKQFSFIVFYTGNSTGNSNCYHVKRIPKKKRKKAEKFFVDVYSPFIM